MRKFLSIMLLSVMSACAFLCVPAFSAEESEDVPQLTALPLSPAFLEWRARMESEDALSDEEDSDSGSPFATTKSRRKYNGVIPFPVDLSHLAKNPPREPASPFANTKASASDSSYDLRTDGYVTSVKNQNPYGTCWAHAAIGAMESNYLVNGGSALDLSEMHLVYFTFSNPTPSKAFGKSTSLTAMLQGGGNSAYAAALYTRLDGPVIEDSTNLKYGSKPAHASPTDYDRVLRVKDVYYLSMTDDTSLSNQTRSAIKQRIIANGGVVINYDDDNSKYNATNTAFYTTSTNVNHAVLIVGWNDNYSASNFKTSPGTDGAWLVKNSWGTGWGDSGYFWMSYASYATDGTAFVVDAVNSDLAAYYYDALGWCGVYGYGTSTTYAANSFQAGHSNTHSGTRSGEKLVEVGFIAPDNNLDYEITIYTDQGTSIPSTPTAGTKAATESGTISTAGYHTITLDSPVPLTQNQYFSVVVKYGSKMIPVEMKNEGFSDNAAIEAGSFFSPNGTYWDTSYKAGANATIKAFTTSAAGESVPTISTSKLSAGTINVAYSAKISAYGKSPITWELSSGSLPDGLALDEGTGTISGTPKTKGDFTFSVLASNDLGTATKSFTISIYDLPIVVAETFTAYKGYAFSGTLTLNTGASATWTAESLPKGIKLDKTTGELSGKPSKEGTYTCAVTAETSAGTSTGTVSIVVNPKPTKAAIKTSSLPQVDVNSAFSQKIEVTGTEPITVTVNEDTMPDGLYFDASTYTFSGTPTETGTFKIEATASNIVNELSGKDATVKKIKLVVKAQAPVINAPESFPSGIVNQAYSTTVELSSGSAPEKWSASGLPKGLNITESGDYAVIAGTPTKSGTFKVTIQAKNNGGKDKTDKIPMIIYMKPEFKTNKLKDGTTDKAYSVKLNIKGSPETVSADNLPDGLEVSKDAKGSFIITGTPTTAGTKDVTIYAENDAGSNSLTMPITIKAVKPKLSGKLPAGSVGTAYSAEITVSGTKPFSTFTCAINDSDKTKYNIASLSELGLTVSTDAATGVITISGTPVYSVKSLPVYVTATNAAATLSKKLTLKIAGTKPAFTSPTSDTVSGAAGSAFTVDFVVTGSEKITFSMKGTSGMTLTQDTEDAHKATLSGTIPSKTTKVTVIAQNSAGKAQKKLEITPTTSSSALYTNTSAGHEESEEIQIVPQEESEPAEESLPQEEQSAIIFGEPRGESSTAKSQTAQLAGEGYTVAAVLPEITAETSGLYDFDVTLNEKAETGRELFWFAYPQNAESSDDDAIAEFYGDDGKEISLVPESRRITISVWLNEGVIYAPVIAAK